MILVHRVLAILDLIAGCGLDVDIGHIHRAGGGVDEGGGFVGIFLTIKSPFFSPAPAFLRTERVFLGPRPGFLGMRRGFQGIRAPFPGMECGFLGMRAGFHGMAPGFPGMKPGNPGMARGFLGIRPGFLGMKSGFQGMAASFPGIPHLLSSGRGGFHPIGGGFTGTALQQRWEGGFYEAQRMGHISPRTCDP